METSKILSGIISTITVNEKRTQDSTQVTGKLSVVHGRCMEIQCEEYTYRPGWHSSAD